MKSVKSGYLLLLDSTLLCLENVTWLLPFSNRVFTEGTCKLLKLVISDLVDEDYVVNRRQQAASALLFGMVALLTKPGQTFAPLIGTWLLCVYTGKEHLHSYAINSDMLVLVELPSCSNP